VPDKQKNWRTVVLNINSVTGKADQLAKLVSYTDPDAILMTETKLDQSIKTSEFMPDHYCCFRRDRKRGGGGVLVAIKSKYAPEEVHFEEIDGEIVWASVSFRSQRKLYLGCFYRPERNSFDALSDSLNQISQKMKNSPNSIIIVGGDLNAGDIDWESLTIKHESKRRSLHERLLSIVHDHHLTQFQKEPTRGQSILDLFFTNKPGYVKKNVTIPGCSDHTGIVLVDCDIRPSYIKSKPRLINMFSRANWEEMKKATLIFQTNFLNSCEDKDIDTCWEEFKKHIETVIEKHVPNKMTSRRYNLPWLTGELKRMCKKQHRAYNKYKKSGLAANKTKFLKLKKATAKAIKKAHWDYVNNILSESLSTNDSKPFWKYIKSKRQENTGIAPLLQRGVLHSNSLDKANILNNQFKSVFSCPDSGSITPRLDGEGYGIIDNLTITCDGVQKLLEKIKPQKASGPDNIPGRVLRELAVEIAPVLTAIFSKSLNTGTLPRPWTKAIVTPIFKKGNKHIAENYRPVSLTCICSKLMEHIICRHMAQHLENKNILTPYQHGFRKQHSCETQLLSTIHELMKYRDLNIQVDLAILDFSKAFDVVPHHSLLGKLEYYGIRGNINKWITNFLIGRQQCVVVEGEQSAFVTVDSGVPQGTVLGPLLFLLHINDLPECVSSSVRLFADDCLLFRPIESPNDQLQLQHDLNALSLWCRRWGMQFNAKKCNILSISRSRTPFLTSYNIEGQILEQVNTAKYLGVTITDELSWSPHVNAISNKANTSLAFLRRNLQACPLQLREMAYFSLVRSILEYSAPVWDPHLKKDIYALEMVQRRGARFVKNDYMYDSSVTAMLEELGWQDLHDRRRELRLTLFFKIIHGFVSVPVNDPSLFKPADQRTRANHPFKYQTIKANTTNFKNSFFVKVVPEWNSLPAAAVCSVSITGFKSKLRAV